MYGLSPLHTWIRILESCLHISYWLPLKVWQVRSPAQKVIFVHNFKTILTAMSQQLPVNPLEFGKLCDSTAQIYVTHYNWYPMPSTLHKILIHSFICVMFPIE